MMREGLMRLLLFADLHLDAPFAWAPIEAARARRRALRDTLGEICRLAVAERVDALCCAGDLYEQERFTPDTAAFLRDTFAQVHPLPIYLAPGNHDWLGPASLYHQVDWTDNVHVFTADRLVPVTLADGFTLWGAGHRAPANTPGFLDDFRVDRGGVNVALFHGSEQGDLRLQGKDKEPHSPFRESQIARAGLQHALVGHFHTPRDAPLHTYPGNPEPLTFGETGPRGAVLVTVGGDGAVTRERHRVSVSEVADIEVDVSGAAHAQQVRDRVAQRLAGLAGTIRVTLSGEVGPDLDLRLDDLAEVAPQLVMVARLGKLTVGYDLDALADEPTVRGQFIRDVRGAVDLTDEQRRKVLITGLRALEGRHDLEVH
jgi:DNA repair exonuclease SbcCD nuclease subunit